MKGLFITGTDTSAGKTAFACALARRVRRHGLTVVALKPVESGCEIVDGELVAADAGQLADAAGAADENCLYRYRASLAPAVAARAEGNPVEVGKVVAWANARMAGADVALVEGAGGWAVPINESALISGVARALALPVLVVGRAGLGTINHTVLSLRAVVADGCELAGFAFSETEAIGPQARESNVGEVQRLAEVVGIIAPFWGVLRHDADGSCADEALELTAAARAWLGSSE